MENNQQTFPFLPTIEPIAGKIFLNNDNIVAFREKSPAKPR